MKKNKVISILIDIAFFAALALLLAIIIVNSVVNTKLEDKIEAMQSEAYFIVDGEVDECSNSGLMFCRVGDKQVVVRIFLDQSIMFGDIGLPAKGQKVKLLNNGNDYFLLSVLSLEDNNA